jgi:glycine oxidase
LEPNQIVDLAVVGGGIIGLSIAWRVRQRGLSVAVIDAGALASESSKAGAGMLAPGGEAHRLSPWARDTVEALHAFPAFTEELAALSGLPIDFRQCGAVDVASSDASWQSLLARRAIQEQLGIPVEEIAESAARRLAPLLREGTFRTLHYPGDAIVDPRSVTAALRLLLERAGCLLREHTRVLAIEPGAGGYTLRHAQGQVRAHAAVLAAGAWSSQIALPAPPGAPRPRTAIPIRGHLARCHRTPGTLGPIVREDHLYVFQRNTGELITGSNEERVGFDRTLNPQAVEQILDRTHQLLPGLFPATATPDAWLGFRPGIEGNSVEGASDDEAGPEVCRLGAERIWLAYGHYRNGILLAPHTASRLATQIAG